MIIGLKLNGASQRCFINAPSPVTKKTFTIGGFTDCLGRFTRREYVDRRAYTFYRPALH